MKPQNATSYQLTYNKYSEILAETFLVLSGLQVIGKMRALMAEDSISMPNNTFLLDVDSR